MKKKNTIPVRNIFYMLAYAFKAIDIVEDKDIDVEKFDNIQDLFAFILSRMIAQLLKRGLSREYLNRTEALPVLRGKLDMPGTIRLKFAQSHRLSCEYDELTENNLHNQILKTAANLLIRSDRPKNEYKDALKKEMFFFSGVAELTPPSIPWSKIRFDRNNRMYRIPLALCYLLIRGLLMTTENGDYKLTEILNKQQQYALYENFIREYFRQEFPGLTVKRAQIKWALDEGAATDQDKLPRMQTDITISNSAGRVLIIDAKFYAQNTQERYFIQEEDDDAEEVQKPSYSKRKVHSHNLYQIYAYVKNMEAEMAGKPHFVSGLLLYARTSEDEKNQPNENYPLKDNPIGVRTLDLNQDFSKIQEQLDGIAEEFFDIRREAAAM